MTDLPCGDSADARYCETFWSRNAEIERLTADLGAARSALQAAQDDSGRLRAELERTRKALGDARRLLNEVIGQFSLNGDPYGTSHASVIQADVDRWRERALGTCQRTPVSGAERQDGGDGK